MRQAHLSLAIVAAVALVAIPLAGCGGGGSDDVEVPAALNNALKYLPKDSAVLAVAPTDLDSGPIKQLDDLATSKVKGWDKIRGKLTDQLQEDASKKQIDALVGNPLAFSASGPDSDQTNIAIQAQDGSVIKQAADTDISKGDAKALPEYQGVFVWQDVDDDDDLNFNGLKGNMLFAADTLQLLEQSIDNSGGSDNLSSNNDYKTELNELGEGALLRVVGDAQQVLENTGSSQQAEKVPFVKALGSFSSKTTVTADGLAEQTTLATDNEDLSADQIPLGAASSLTLPTAEGFAGIAINDPDQIVKFIEATLKQVNTAAYDQYQQGVGALKATGVDLHKDLLGAMKQISVSVVGKNEYEFRADLTDGAQFSEALSKAEVVIQGALGTQGDGQLTLNNDGSGTYTIKQGNQEVARFAVKGNTLVGSVGPSAGLPSPTQGGSIAGSGSIGLEVVLSKIASLPGLEDEIDDPLARDVLSSLGTATQTITETTDQITEKSQVTVGSGSSSK